MFSGIISELYSHVKLWNDVVFIIHMHELSHDESSHLRLFFFNLRDCSINNDIQKETIHSIDWNMLN